MTYDEASFDDSRLRSYARRVASAAMPLHSWSQVARFREERKGLFRTKSWVIDSHDIEGWIVLADRCEGQAVCWDVADARPYTLDAWEHGRLLYLTSGGELRTADYSTFHSMRSRRFSSGAEGLVSEIKEDRAATVWDLIAFDRLNRGAYRVVGRQKSEAWRRELSLNWRTNVPSAGMEASLALKRLLETGTYIRSLSIAW